MAARLTYFDGRGLGEAVRLVLAAADVPFTDVTATREWFAGARTQPDTLLFGQLPLLELDTEPPLDTAQGKEAATTKCVQSMAIVRHLAREHGLYGATPEDALRCDMIADTVRDVLGAFLGLPFATAAGGGTMARATAAAAVVKVFPRLEAILAANAPSPFFVGSSLTYPDVTSVEIVEYALQVFPAAEFEATFPLLAAHHAAVLAVPGLAAYLHSPRRRLPGGGAYVAHVSNVLGRSIDAVVFEVGAKYHIEYGGFLTNHATHAAVALKGLFPSPRVWRPFFNAFLDMYKARLSEAPASEAGDPEDVHALVGLLSGPPDYAVAALAGTLDNTARTVGCSQAGGPWPWRAAVSAAHAVLVEDAGSSSMATLLTPTLLLLAPGIHSAAFHAFIHLGWGLDAGSPAMVAEGWVYLLASHTRLYEPVTMASSESPFVASLEHPPSPYGLAIMLRNMARSLGVAAPGSDSKFQARMRELAQDEGTAHALAEVQAHTLAAITAWGLEPDALVSLFVDTALVAYHASGHEFFVLHIVSAAHALRCMVATFDNSVISQLAAALFAAAVAAAAVEGVPWDATRVELLHAPPRSPDPVAFVTSKMSPLSGAMPDEHILKLARVIQVANEACPTAARAAQVGLLTPSARTAVLANASNVSHFVIAGEPSVSTTVQIERDAW